MENTEMKNLDRRKLLISAPVVAGLALADGALISLWAAPPQTMAPSGSDPFTLFSATNIEDDFKSLADSPGNKIIYRNPNLSIMLTVEKTASADEFEWHEHRDHVFHVLDGTTIYELGGTPKNAHNLRPGEWLSPASEGAKTVTLSAGDVLVVPRGTPHRRRTPASVTLILVSPGAPPV
jgi:quercetin dioxygenase-like cupin family protein